MARGEGHTDIAVPTRLERFGREATVSAGEYAACVYPSNGRWSVKVTTSSGAWLFTSEEFENMDFAECYAEGAVKALAVAALAPTIS